jgi:hypothetical protein
VICLDRNGTVLWRKTGWFVHDVLPDDRWLGNWKKSGRPNVFDSGGTEVAELRLRAEIVKGVCHHDRLALASRDGRVIVTDLSLAPIAEFPWPGQGESKLDCLMGRYFHWVEGNDIWRVDFQGRAERIAEVPIDRVLQAMTDYDLETGQSAMEGVVISLPGSSGNSSDCRALTVGDRPRWYPWSLYHVPESSAIFFSTLTAPHVLLCMDEDFELRWCRYIHWGCCGGRGYRLPDGLWATSSGCGGVLTWLDGSGNVLFRSEPHAGGGLAIAYSHCVTVLESGLVLVSGAPGLSAYERGELVWEMNGDIFGYGVIEDLDLLLVSWWERSSFFGSSVFLEAYPLPAA